MNPDNITAIGLFIAAQTIAGVAAFFTVRADVKNLKGWVKDIAADTKSTAKRAAKPRWRSSCTKSQAVSRQEPDALHSVSSGVWMPGSMRIR